MLWSHWYTDTNAREFGRFYVVEYVEELVRIGRKPDFFVNGPSLIREGRVKASAINSRSRLLYVKPRTFRSEIES